MHEHTVTREDPKISFMRGELLKDERGLGGRRRQRQRESVNVTDADRGERDGNKEGEGGGTRRQEVTEKLLL